MSNVLFSSRSTLLVYVPIADAGFHPCISTLFLSRLWWMCSNLLKHAIEHSKYGKIEYSKLAWNVPALVMETLRNGQGSRDGRQLQLSQMTYSQKEVCVCYRHHYLSILNFFLQQGNSPFNGHHPNFPFTITRSLFLLHLDVLFRLRQHSSSPLINYIFNPHPPNLILPLLNLRSSPRSARAAFTSLPSRLNLLRGLRP